MTFDVTKARRVAEDYLAFCVLPEDADLARVGMTLRAACNEIEALRYRAETAEAQCRDWAKVCARLQREGKGES